MASTPPPPTAPLIATPVAIVAAGALIGLGLFLGLRRDPEPTAVAAPPAPSAASSSAPVLLGPGTAPTPTAAPSPTVTASAVVDKKAVASQLRAALDQHKKNIVEQCVAPSMAKKPAPDHVNLTFNFSIDASGKQVARGISEDRETSRSDVTQCVQSKLPAISIPPPGATVFVEEILWRLP